MADAIVAIAQLLTARWFTDNVPADTRSDLMFHDALCLWQDGELRSFIVFTSIDGSISITLMGTHPDHQGRGYGQEIELSGAYLGKASNGAPAGVLPLATSRSNGSERRRWSGLPWKTKLDPQLRRVATARRGAGGAVAGGHQRETLHSLPVAEKSPLLAEPRRR